MRKRVFISSVIKGYEDYREAARAALTDLNQEPVIAENFAASTKSPRAACLEGVRSSEIYLGLFGSRYSRATVDEYEEAKERGIQILVFIEHCQKEPMQDEFISLVEDYSGGHFRDSYSKPEELYRKIVKALSAALTAEVPNFTVGDQRVISFGGSLRKEREHSWLWIVLAPAIEGTLIPSSSFVKAAFHEEILEIALDRKVGLFDIRLASDAELRGDSLALRQRDPNTHGSAVVRRVVMDRIGCVEYGSALMSRLEWKSSFASSYIDPDLVKTTVESFFRFADRFVRHVDSSARVPAFSLGCYLLGTDKHFERPVPNVNTMTMPWATGNFPDPLMVPRVPLHLGVQELNRGGFYAEETVALLKQAFSGR